ncbi:GNAT family N-acetyltransferase [Thalassoglobus sp.]|uniref:GNAT family N-acetyltransferase n=1 Tax=Thalassoglobus sp. TaxID=2795869 RepID=UPI003AA96CE7
MRFRTFRNDDPPQLFSLCRQVELGRGAAKPESIHAFELAVYGLPYFDPEGLIIAEENGKIAGFVHAGFGFSDDLNSLDQTKGVICWLVVSQQHQRSGIGKQLIQLGEEYLLNRGATSIQAGQSRYRDPFYFGLYGGARCSGFLQSDRMAAPFLKSVGYEPIENTDVFQRDLTSTRDPMNLKIMKLRRITELQIADQPEDPSYWWLTHFGNIDSMLYTVVNKKTKVKIASLTAVNLDHFIQRWGERVVGLVDVYVEPSHRGEGYATLLVVEALRQLKSNFTTRAEVHVAQDHPTALQAISTAGFEKVDTSTVYQKKM